jgi:ribose-phosphate pyrophosphokinase
MYVLGGTASKSIAKDIAQLLDAKLIDIILKRFPDTELYIRILERIKNKHIIIVQTTYPDQNIIELFLLQSAAIEAGAKKITVVIPYFGYSRQDKLFEDGEAISSKALAHLISVNADKVIVVDPHKENILKFFTVEANSCSAINEIAEYLKSKNLDMLLAPDKGALSRVKKASTLIGCEYDYMEKTRIDGDNVQMKPKELPAKDRRVAIIDDIISTGGTMALAIKELKKNGARKVFVACTHGLFAGDAIKKLVSAGCDEIIASDTINSSFSKVKVAPCIVDFISK